MSKLQKLLQTSEDALLVGLLLLMMLMAVGQIILRNLFDSGLIWGDSLVRVLVLWVGFLGATAATRANNHINIDVLSRFFPPRLQCITTSITLLFTSGLCGLTAFYSARFVKMEWQYKSPGFAAVPAWLCESIIPLAFALIALRCLLMSVAAFRHFCQASVEDCPLQKKL